VLARFVFIAAIAIAVVGGAWSTAWAGETWQEAELTDLGVDAVDFVYDRIRGEIHAALDSNDPRYPNSLVSMDPVSGSIISSVFLGDEPNLVEISDDGRYLYVGLDNVEKVVRIDLLTRSIDLVIPLVHPVDPGEAIVPSAIVPLWGLPTSFAVALSEPQTNEQFFPYGVQVFDGSVARPTVSRPGLGERLIRGDGDVLYGGSPASSSLATFGVLNSGIEVRSTARIGVKFDEYVSAFGDSYVFYEGTQLSFPPGGLVVDLISGTPVELPRIPLEGNADVVQYDSDTRSVFYASNTDKDDESSNLIEQIDPSTYLRLGRTIVYGEISDAVSQLSIEPTKIERLSEGTFALLVSYPNGERFRSAILLVAVTNSVDASPVGLVDLESGVWSLRDRWGFGTSFYYGNPGDYPFMGDWDCDGNETPGLYRQSDGFAYLRNSNTQGVADISFFFGNPGDQPIAGDFNGDGCDTVAIYRPSESRFYIVNELGDNNGGLGRADYSFVFGNPGDKPVVGDWDGDGTDEVGLYRETTGLFYYRNTLDSGIASDQFFFGNPGDRFIAGDSGPVPNGVDTPAILRPSDGRIYFRYQNAPGDADGSLLTWGDDRAFPVAGEFSFLTVALSAQGGGGGSLDAQQEGRGTSDLILQDRSTQPLLEQGLARKSG